MMCRLDYLVIGNPENRRVKLFQAALTRCGRPPAHELPYAQLIEDPNRLGCWLDQWQAHTESAARLCIRLESPGENAHVYQQLVELGMQLDGRPAKVVYEHGRIQHMREWFAGYSHLLCGLADQARQPTNVRFTSPPEDVLLAFDKPTCYAHLAARGLALPETLTGISSYEHLLAAMRDRGWNRVFVKLATGSSASGVVALTVTPTGSRAVTSVEMQGSGPQTRFYNNLRLSCYTDPRQLSTLIDFLCNSGAHIERWLPKAVLGQCNFDLRLLVIAGQPRHCVVRSSRSPITNLHLGNQRGDLAELRQRMPREAWLATLQLARDAAAAFPRSHMLGLDVLLQPRFRRPTLLEVNAFGDLLPGLLDREEDSYEAQIRAFRWPHLPGVHGNS